LTPYPGAMSRAALHMVAQVILYGAVRALLRTARGLLKLGSILFRAGLVGRVEVRYYSTGLTASSAARIAFAHAADFEQGAEVQQPEPPSPARALVGRRLYCSLLGPRPQSKSGIVLSIFPRGGFNGPI
jgi:hypothetical protein